MPGINSAADNQLDPPELQREQYTSHLFQETVNIDNFLDSLRKESSMIEENIKQRKTSEDEPTQIIRLQRKNSQLKLMTNLVESYNNICEPSEKNESFFINMM